ncbi:MAG TPA: hypothetical protein VE957_08125 [Terriglobales bacterium]|nr:hypothetical protein [Terriglobales bacterium]
MPAQFLEGQHMTAPAVPAKAAARAGRDLGRTQETKHCAKAQDTSQEALLREVLDNDAKYNASSIETTVLCAQNVQRAKKELTAANFQRFRAEMRHDASDISVYITIAENEHITNPDNWQYLPSGWTVLVILARHTMNMTADGFRSLIDSKQIHPGITRQQTRALAGVKPKSTRKLSVTETPTPVRTALAAADEADHMDAAEHLAETAQPVDATTPKAATDSETTHNLVRQVTKKTAASSSTTVDNNIVFAPDIEDQLQEYVKTRLRRELNQALRSNGIHSRYILIQ